MYSDKKFNSDYDAYFKKNIQNNEFVNSINKLRIKYRISTEQFISQIEIDKWKSKSANKEKVKRIRSELESFFNKFNIKPSYYDVLELYFFSGYYDYFFDPIQNYFSCDLELVEEKKGYSEMEKKWNKCGKKYIRIYFEENVSLKILNQFIKQRWSEIEYKLNKNSKYRNPKRTNDLAIARNREISKLTNLAKKKLYDLYLELRKSGSPYLPPNTPREIIISNVMCLKGFEVTSENVKKIIQRMKQKKL